MDTLQKLFDAELENSSDAIMARLVRKKFEEFGIKLSEDQVSTVVTNLGAGEYSFELDDAQLETEERSLKKKIDNITIDFSDDDIQDAVGHFSGVLSSLIPDLVRVGAETLRHELGKTAASQVRSLKKDRRNFEARLDSHWGNTFELLDIYLAIAKEAGADFNEQYRPVAVKEQDLVFEVVTRLHARACQIASEIIMLLKAGYADGAHARWRSLHEVAAVALFVQKHGRETANRYMLHDVVESNKAAKQYQEYCKALGQKPLSKQKIERLQKMHDLAIRQFGASFGKEYGWAALALGNPNPRFFHIEKDVSLTKLRPYYKLASHNVHAGPRGIAVRLGLPPENQVDLLAGPSDIGLTDPAHGTAISLLQIMSTLMLLKPNLDHLIMVAVLNALQKEIGEEALKAQKILLKRKVEPAGKTQRRRKRSKRGR